ncbi:Ldh family oxidoreductase [Stenoxybacter acetivorans]|uniref:Ldh family oxidoreductase n=1 Tax=Stenoxybacter acetivorans TaxID=422441 RepID=UPI001B803D28|nr:Ldh family oxidoreductase [Stenoxybacter acetivorans]
MIKINNNTAEQFIRAVLLSKNVPESVATDVAEHLIASDKAGYASHGLSILPSYVKAIKQGTLKADAMPECIKRDGVLLGYDAHLGFGQHAAKVAFHDAIEQAKENGLCALTLRHAHHIGRTGFFGEMACKEGLALFAFTNIIKRVPTVAPFGGGKAKLTTNPLCFAWPLPHGGDSPFLLDLATSTIALNRARILAARGEPAPADSLIDEAGYPTSNPNVMWKDANGALLTFGAHKGYGLGLAVELFAGILSGGGTIYSEHEGNGMAVNNIFAIVLDIKRFVDEDWATTEAENFIQYLKDTPPQPGFKSVQYPGEYEANNRKKYAEHIEMDDISWQTLVDLSADTGIALPEAK